MRGITTTLPYNAGTHSCISLVTQTEIIPRYFL
jgi:hypothetical protein